MKIFQIIQKNFALMEFVPNQQQKNSRTFSRAQIIKIFWCTLSSSLIAVHFFHVTNSMEECMYSLFALTNAIAFTLSYASVVYKNDKIFNIIDAEEKMLNDSESFVIL